MGPNAPTVAGGEEAAAALTNRWSTAYLAYNDQVAIGFIRRLMATGTKVPGDVSVVGFDNIYAADLVTPSLTTVAAPLHVLGTTAVRNLLAIINGATPRASEPLVLPVHLVERGSTGPAPRRRRERRQIGTA